MTAPMHAPASTAAPHGGGSLRTAYLWLTASGRSALRLRLGGDRRRQALLRNLLSSGFSGMAGMGHELRADRLPHWRHRRRRLEQSLRTQAAAHPGRGRICALLDWDWTGCALCNLRLLACSRRICHRPGLRRLADVHSGDFAGAPARPPGLAEPDGSSHRHSDGAGGELADCAPGARRSDAGRDPRFLERPICVALDVRGDGDFLAALPGRGAAGS